MRTLPRLWIIARYSRMCHCCFSYHADRTVRLRTTTPRDSGTRPAMCCDGNRSSHLALQSKIALSLPGFQRATARPTFTASSSPPVTAMRRSSKAWDCAHAVRHAYGTPVDSDIGSQGGRLTRSCNGIERRHAERDRDNRQDEGEIPNRFNQTPATEDNSASLAAGK